MRRLIAAVAFLGIPGVVSAQRQQGAPANAPNRSTISTAEAIGAVRGRLLLLVEAQEAHFADHGTYTKDLAALQLSGKGKARSPVHLEITHANKRSWRATGRHSAHPNKSCVIFTGAVSDFPVPATKTDKRQPSPAQSGQPICDDP